MLARFRSKRTVVCVDVGGVRRKITQIMFAKSDGSLFVSFPYYAHSHGLASVATHEPGTSTVSLETNGRVTSHLVKYAHHPDGRAHFSQDGKVQTEVKRQAAPLNRIHGHLFTVHIQGLDSFEPLKPDLHGAEPTLSRAYLSFNFPNLARPPAVKLVAYLYPEAEVEGQSPSDALHGPRVMSVDPQGRQRPAFLISPPAGAPGAERILLLTCEDIPSLTNDEAALGFIGGFDPTPIGGDEPCHFLALSYPASDSNGPAIPSIDLFP